MERRNSGNREHNCIENFTRRTWKTNDIAKNVKLYLQISQQIFLRAGFTCDYDRTTNIKFKTHLFVHCRVVLQDDARRGTRTPYSPLFRENSVGPGKHYLRENSVGPDNAIQLEDCIRETDSPLRRPHTRAPRHTIPLSPSPAAPPRYCSLDSAFRILLVLPPDSPALPPRAPLHVSGSPPPSPYRVAFVPPMPQPRPAEEDEDDSIRAADER